MPRLLTGAGAVAGVLGWPVAHSRSPLLHNFWLERHGIDGAYVPLPVTPARFRAAVDGIRAAGLRGANVTIPHKEAAFGFCDTLDSESQQAGAVNTLVFTGEGVHGMNTDGAGFVANLRAHGVNPCAGMTLMLGAGGAARAIAASLLHVGADVMITNRSAERAQALAHALPGLKTLAWERRAAALADAALVINTTPCGMHAAPALPLSLDCARSNLVVADIVYAPMVTPLLAEAAVRGLRCVGGLGMLLHQAVPGFAAWFGVTPRVDDEVEALLRGSLAAKS